MAFDLLQQYMFGPNAQAQGQPSVTPTPMPMATPSPMPGDVPQTYPSGTPGMLAAPDAMMNPYAAGLMDKKPDDAPPPSAPPQQRKAAPMGPQSIHVDEQAPERTPIAQGPDELDQYKVTPEEMQDASRRKMTAKMISGLGDIFANQQSAGNYYLGHMAPKTTVTDFSDMADQGVKDKMALYKQAYQSRLDKSKLAENESAAEISKQSNDPNSGISKIWQGVAQKSAADLGMDPKQYAGMSAAQIQASTKDNAPFNQMVANNKMLREQANAIAVARVKGDTAKDVAETKADAMASGRETTNVIKQDNQSAGIVNKIHTDPAIVQMKQQARNIDKGKETLARPGVSWTELNEVAQDYSGALSGKGIASDFKLREIKKPMLDEKMGDLMAYAKSNPDQPASPEAVKFWKNFGDRLSGAYDSQLAGQAANRLRGIETAYKHNPNAVKAAQEAASTYRTGSWRQADDSVFGDMPKETSAAAPKTNGKVKVSNGKETLEIDASDLPHAQADGYKPL